MGNQLAASGSAAAVNLSDISDNAKHLQLVAPLGGAKRGRLFTSLHCRQLTSSSDVVIKVFVQRAEDKAQAAAINSHQDALYMIELQMRRYFKDNPEAPCNLLLYTIRSRHGGYCLLQRPYIHYSLAERMQMRPFWQPVQRLFACYQLLQALVQLHEGCKCTHGDLKPENVLLSSQDWLYITDFCPFKPPSLPIDNPANFEFFYDNSETRYCCCGPEKFADKMQQGSSPLPLASPTSAAIPSLSSAAAATSPSSLTTNPVTAIARKASFKSTGGEHHHSSHHQHTHGGAVPEEAAEPYPPYHSSVANSLHYNNTPTSVSTFGTILGATAGAGAGAGGGPAGSISNGINTRASVASVGGGISNFFGNNGGKEEQFSYHLASADVFAAACVIIFILTDEPIFKLSSALEFNGKNPSERRAFLLKELTHRRVTNEPIREMLCAMMCCEPSQRPSASHILRQFSPCVFPHSFAFLHANVIPTVQQMPPDAQIHFMFNRHSDLLQTADVCDSDSLDGQERPHKGEKEKESGEDGTNLHTARERFIEVMGMNSEAFNQTLDREDRTEDAREPSTANSGEGCAVSTSTTIRHLVVPLSPPNAAARERLTTLLLPYLASALRFARSSDARSRALIIMRRWLEWSSEASRRDTILPWARQVLQSRRAGLQPRVNAVRTLREALLSLPTLTTSEAFLFEDYVLEVFESLMREPGVLAPQVTNSIVGTAATSSMEGVVLLQPMLSLLTEIAASLPAMLLVGCSYVRQRQRIYAQIAQHAADRKNKKRGQRNEQGGQEESLSSDDDDAVREGDYGQNGGTRNIGDGEKINTPTTVTSAAAEDYAFATPSFDSELREVVDRGWELLKVLLSANQSAVAIAALEQTPALCRVLGQERVVSELLPILTTFLSTTAAEVKTAFLQQVPFLAAFLQGSVGAGGGSTHIGIGSGPSAVASFLSMVLEDGLKQPDVACVCAALESVRVIATTMSIPSESIMPTVSVALRHVHSPNAWIQDRACLMVEEIARKYSPSELLLHVVRPMLGRLKRAVPLVCIRSHSDALKAFWEVGEGGSNPPGLQASDPFFNSYALSSSTMVGANSSSNTNNIHVLICSDPLPPCVDYLAAVYDPSRIIATGSREVVVRASEESPLASSHADIYTPDLAAAKTHTASSKRGGGVGGGATARSNTMSAVGQSTTTSVNLHTTANMSAYNNKSFVGAVVMSGAMGMATTSASFTAAMGSPTLSSPSSSSPPGGGGGSGGGGVGGLVSVGVTAAALVQRLVHTYESFTVSTTAAGCMRRGDNVAHNAYSLPIGDPIKEDILIVVSGSGDETGDVISSVAAPSSTALVNSIMKAAASSRLSHSIRVIRPWRMSVFKPTARQLKRIDARDQLYLPNPPHRQNNNNTPFELIGNNNTTTATLHNGGGGTFSSPNIAGMSSTASPPSLTSVGGTGGGVRTRSSIFGGTSSIAGGGGSESDGTNVGSSSNTNHHRNLFAQWDQQNPNNVNNSYLASLNADEAVHVGGPSAHPLTARESRGVGMRASGGLGGTRASLASTYSPSSATTVHHHQSGGGGGSERSLTRGSMATAAATAYGGGGSSGSMSASASASSSAHHPSSSASAGTLRPIASALATHNGPAWDPLAAPITCMSTGGSLIMTGGARGLVSLWDAEYMVRSRRCSPHHFKGVVPASETVLFAQFTYNMNSPAVIGSTDSTLRLFDPQTEALYATHTYASATEGALRACVRLTPNVTLVGSDGGSLFAVDWRSRSSSVWSTRVALPEGGVTALVSLHHQLQQQQQQASGGGLGGGIGAAVGDPMLGDAYGFVAGTSEGYVSLFDLRFRLSVKSFSAIFDSSSRAKKGHHAAAHSPSPSPSAGAWRSVLSLCLDPRTTNRVDIGASFSSSTTGSSAPSVMVSTADGALRRFALETGEPTLRLQPFCSSLDGSPNGYGCASRAMLHIPRTPMMITGSDDGLIRLWDFSTPRLSRTLACLPQRSGRYDYFVPNSISFSDPKNCTDPNTMLYGDDNSNVPVIIERDPTTAWQSSSSSGASGGGGGASSSGAATAASVTANYGGSHPYGIATFTYHNTTTSAANISIGIGACATARYGGGGGVAVSGAGLGSGAKGSGAAAGGMGARVGSGGGGGLKGSSSSSSFPPYAFDPLAPLHGDHITALAVVTARGSQYLVSAARDGSLKLWGNQLSSSARGGKGGKGEDDYAY